MCKVLAIAGIKPGQKEIIEKIARAAVEEFQFTDGDGFGYAAMTEDGKIYGEKWLRKEDAFILHKNPELTRGASLLNSVIGVAAKKKFTETEKVYSRFGCEMTPRVLGETVAFMMHARKKTIGDKVIENTHPFFHPETDKQEATALIHNGSIRNHEKLTKLYSTCDSETILHEYLNLGMNYVPDNIDALASRLVGEYTTMVMSHYLENETHKIIPYLDIFKSNKDLYAGYIKELDNIVYCTSDFSLKAICQKANLTLEEITEIDDGYLIRLDAKTGVPLIDTIEFTKSEQYIRATVEKEETKKLTPLEQAKQDFKEKHPELFSSPYFMVAPLTDEEKKVLAAFERENDQKNLRAIALLKNSLVKNV